MNLIDRYILKRFIETFLFAVLALCVIFLVVNLMENLDEFLDRQVAFSIIAEYYLSFFPEILKLLTPVAMLISTLFSIGGLSNNNELTAMKTGGLSLYRLMAPLVLVSLLISAGQLYFNGWIVPVANQNKIAIERKYLSNKGEENGVAYNLFFRDNPNRNVVMQYYNSNERTAYHTAIEEFTNDTTPRLVSRVECEKLQWDGKNKNWKIINGIKREFFGKQVVTSRFQLSTIVLKIKHDQLRQLKREPDEMNFDETRAYIEILKIGGKDIRRQLIDYYSSYAFPLANFIVILFGVPFASVKKKGGIAIQIAAAMIIAFAYLIFTELSKTIGFEINLNPIITGWLANIIFFVAGLVVLFKTKT